MNCHYCGNLMSSDELSYNRTIGVITDGPDGEFAEELTYTGGGVCEICGNHTKSVVLDYEYESLDYEHYTPGRGDEGGRVT